MLTERHFSVPDRVFFVIANLVVVATIVLAFMVWPSMPAQLPAQYGWNGQAGDVLNSRLTVFLIPPLFQLLILFLAAWAYRHPQSFSFPTREKFSSFPTDTQRTLVTIARHMLAVLTVVGTLILAQVFATIVLTGLGLESSLNIAAMLFLVYFLVFMMVVYLGYLRQIIQRSRPQS